MYSLVEFIEDKKLRVVKNDSIGRKGKRLYAPYGRFKYPCIILQEGGKYKILKKRYSYNCIYQ